MTKEKTHIVTHLQFDRYLAPYLVNHKIKNCEAMNVSKNHLPRSAADS